MGGGLMVVPNRQGECPVGEKVQNSKLFIQDCSLILSYLCFLAVKHKGS